MTISKSAFKFFSIYMACVAVVAALFDPTAASAQTLGNMMCSISHNLAPFEKLFVGLSYVAGAICIGAGITQLGFFTDTINAGRQYGIARPKGYLIAGAGLLALPAFLRLMVNSLFNFSSTSDAGGGLSACIPYIGYGGQAGSVGLDGLVLNLVMNIKGPMVFMLSVISILIGIFLVIDGLLTASKYGKDSNVHSIPKIMTKLIIGTILYTVGTSLNEIIATVFGDSAIDGPGRITSAIAADFGADTQPFQTAVYAALTFFQLIGMIAFIRGWMILKDAVENKGQKTVAQGLTHIFGGVLAVNIYRFLQAMDATFGTGFL
jgi:hypothetical protein